MLAKRVRQTGLKAGDEFIVQCMSEDFDYGDGTGTLLHQGRFTVTQHYEVPSVDEENERSPRQYMKQVYDFMQSGIWEVTPHAKEEPKRKKEAA